MAFWTKTKDFMSRAIYDEPDEEKVEGITEEETDNYVETAKCSEDISKVAETIISDSLKDYDDNKEVISNISKVQFVLDTTGTDVDHEMFRKILINLVGCNLEELEKDGVNRQQAIRDMLERKRTISAQHKAEKEASEEELLKMEKEAEQNCSEKISSANKECERLIEEEKQRSAETIAEIRRRTDEVTESAKQDRDVTLKDIAEKRSSNEESLKNSANLLAELERQCQEKIDQIEFWCSFLK